MSVLELPGNTANLGKDSSGNVWQVKFECSLVGIVFVNNLRCYLLL